MTAIWTGQWVADRLGIGLDGAGSVGGLGVPDLVGMAVRRNPRRTHLLVSRVLGKHVPIDPDVALGAGRLLGTLVAERLAGADGGGDGGRLLGAVLAGAGRAALAALRDRLDRDAADRAPVDALVLGYAETATALGHAVADALGADYLHSTRRAVPGLTPFGGFEEAHSHATSHLLLPEDPALLGRPRPLVLVDDELSTGATVRNTIAELHAAAPRARYVVAALVDLRPAAERRRLHEFAAALGVRIDVVALATGTLRLPADVLPRGQELVRRVAAGVPRPGSGARARLDVVGGWPAGVRDGGRHGFGAADRAPFDAAILALAGDLAASLAGRVLVLGTEELMYLPMRLAAALAGATDPGRVRVRVSSTTRSPVLAVDHPGYAVRTALRFGSHDAPSDGAGQRFAYNVAPPAGEPGFDRVVVVADDASLAWPAEGGLLDALAAVTGAVMLVTVPSHVPAGVR